MWGKETDKKSKVLKTKKRKKHELYPLAKRPSPQVLCNECIPYKRTSQIKCQKPKKVEAIKKNPNKGLERHNVEEMVPHCLSAPSTKALMRMTIMHGLACQ
jgi:hypothetical protein